MSSPRIFSLLLLFGLASLGRATDELLDHIDQELSLSTCQDQVRLRLSGTLDLEAYHFSRPAPGLIDSTSGNLFSPRLTLFVDGQIGPHVYAFVQVRADTGYDPSDYRREVRLDEYAIRITPWDDGRLNVQVGKFASVVGRWHERHLSWDNPFIDAPLAYENVTALSDIEAPTSRRDFATTRITPGNKYEYNPIVWDADYATGVAISGYAGKWDLAAELKNSALTARPEAWDLDGGGFAHPTVSGRLGFRPDEAWNCGLSASSGPYLMPEVKPSLPQGRGIGDYRETVLAQDISYAWHHWQIWAEAFEARFDVPRAGRADTLAYFIEAKYKFMPQLFGALRWNQQLFANLRPAGPDASWGDDTWRVDAAVSYRFTAHTQLKLQYDIGRDDTGRRGFDHMVAAQFTLRF